MTGWQRWDCLPACGICPVQCETLFTGVCPHADLCIESCDRAQTPHGGWLRTRTIDGMNLIWACMHAWYIVVSVRHPASRHQRDRDDVLGSCSKQITMV